MNRWPYFALFGALIISGIVMKRVFGHAEWLPPFHIAALFVLIGISLSAERARRRRKAALGLAVESDEAYDDEYEEELAWDDV